MYLQLLDGEEAVVLRALEVDHRGALILRFPVWALDRDRDAVADQIVLFLVDLQQRGGGEAVFHGALRLVELRGRDPRVQPLQRRAEVAREQDLLVAPAPEGAVLAQSLGVVGIGDVPAQLVAEQIARRALDEDVFGVFVGHGMSPFKYLMLKLIVY